jgi:hypothetical protein
MLIIDAVTPLYATLPQSAVLPENTLARWLTKTQAVLGLGGGPFDPLESLSSADRVAIAWHLRRAKGLGSSEIGSLVAESRGQYSPFGGAFVLSHEKALRWAPSSPSPIMERDTRMEPMVQWAFHQKAGVRTDTEALAVLKKAVHPQFSWWLGTPDDLVVDAQGRRFLVDYKVPSECVREAPVSLEYRAQLHHLTELAITQGISVYGMLSVPFDLARGEVVIKPVMWDPVLIDEMKDVGHAFWHNVVTQGIVLPKNEAPPLPEAPAEAVAQWQAQSRAFARWKAVEAHAKKEADAVRGALSKTLSDLGTMEAHFEGALFKGKRVPSVEQLAPLSGALGYPVTPQTVQQAAEEGVQQGLIAPEDTGPLEYRVTVPKSAQPGLPEMVFPEWPSRKKASRCTP